MNHHEVIQRALVEKIVSVEGQRNEAEIQLGESTCEVRRLKEEIKRLEARMSDGEYGLLDHIHPDFGGWEKKVFMRQCGCTTTHYIGKDLTGEKEDIVVEVFTDSMGSTLVE